MTTTDLSCFSNNELYKLEMIICAMREQGLPKNFSNDGVKPMLNKLSGNVFLTNDEYQVAMYDGQHLRMFYYLSYEGNEGFADELYTDFKNGNVCSEDYEELAYILDQEGMTEEATDVRCHIE